MLFFIFSKFSFFGVVRGAKGQKKVQNDKKFCPSCLISWEPYIIWLLHMCKMIISQGFFFIFSKFWFFLVFRGDKRGKNDPKCQKLLPVAFHISGNIHHVTVIYGTHLWNDNTFQCFFHFFFNFDFLGSWQVKRAKNGPEWQKTMSAVLHISGTIHHMIVVYGANV